MLPVESGKHRLRFAIVDQDLKPIHGPHDLEMQIPQMGVHLEMPLEFENVEFPRPDTYYCSIVLNGIEIRCEPLHVRQIPSQPR